LYCAHFGHNPTLGTAQNSMASTRQLTSGMLTRSMHADNRHTEHVL